MSLFKIGQEANNGEYLHNKNTQDLKIYKYNMNNGNEFWVLHF